MKSRHGLTENGELIFQELVKQLGISIKEIDVFELSILAEYLDEFEKNMKEWEKLGKPFLNKHDQIHPLKTDRKNIMEAILKLGDRFGINPLSRAKNKIGVSSVETEKKGKLTKWTKSA